MSGGAVDPASHRARTFFLLRCLGRGAFGDVYLAEMASPDGSSGEVALKLLRSSFDLQSRAVRRIRDEGRLLARLDHPGLLTVNDLVVLDGRIGLVADYLPGADLKQILQQTSVPQRPLTEIIAQAAEALHAAFALPVGDGVGALGLVHHDMKPANIRVGEKGEVKLVDFGITRSAHLNANAHDDHHVAADSSMYLAPERVNEEAAGGDETEAPANGAADIFSLGCSFYEGLTREPVFHGFDLKRLRLYVLRPEKYAQHIGSKLARLPSDLPSELRNLLSKMLDPEPAIRPTAKQVADACRRLVAELEGPSLPDWCGNFAWPEAEHVPKATFGGRMLLETPDERMTGPIRVPGRSVETHELALPPSLLAELAEPQEQAPARKTWVGVASLLMLILFALFGLIAGGVAIVVGLRLAG